MLFKASPSIYTLLLTVACGSAAASSIYSHCYQAASERYGVSASLLRAIAIVESSENPGAINDSHSARTGSRDLGLMQINSRHLTRLSRYGITQAELLKPCVSAAVGAWVLTDLIARHGYTWEAVGAYNAACTQLKGVACERARRLYVTKVQRALARIASQSPSASHTSLVAMRFDTKGGLHNASNQSTTTSTQR
jgi:soluble lytic murein transglycosylase-like protein